MIAISRIRASLKRERCSKNTLPGDKDKEENGGGMEEGEEGGEEVVMLVETEVEIGSLDGIKLSLSVERMQAGRCWFIASSTGPCVCAGYKGRCCSAGNKPLELEEEVEVTRAHVATFREAFLRLRGR